VHHVTSRLPRVKTNEIPRLTSQPSFISHVTAYQIHYHTTFHSRPSNAKQFKDQTYIVCVCVCVCVWCACVWCACVCVCLWCVCVCRVYVCVWCACVRVVCVCVCVCGVCVVCVCVCGVVCVCVCVKNASSAHQSDKGTPLTELHQPTYHTVTHTQYCNIICTQYVIYRHVRENKKMGSVININSSESSKSTFLSHAPQFP